MTGPHAEAFLEAARIVTKHGQASVVRALARKERAPGDITAF